MFAQFFEARQIIRGKGFLKPDDVVAGQHTGRFDGPLVAVRPELLRATRIDHQLDIGADGLASGFDQQLIILATDPAKLVPTQLKSFEAPFHGGQQPFFENRRLVEEEGAIGLDPVPVNAS